MRLGRLFLPPHPGLCKGSALLLGAAEGAIKNNHLVLRVPCCFCAFVCCGFEDTKCTSPLGLWFRFSFYCPLVSRSFPYPRVHDPPRFLSCLFLHALPLLAYPPIHSILSDLYLGYMGRWIRQGLMHLEDPNKHPSIFLSPGLE